MSFPPSTAKPESSVHHSVESVLPSELISKNYQTLDDDLELEDLPESNAYLAHAILRIS